MESGCELAASHRTDLEWARVGQFVGKLNEHGNDVQGRHNTSENYHTLDEVRGMCGARIARRHYTPVRDALRVPARPCRLQYMLKIGDRRARGARKENKK